MDTTTHTVTVYHFTQAARGETIPMTAVGKATRHTIVDVVQGEVLEGTAEDVEVSQLDPHGFYRRVATGWGELD